jgi:pseudaminic acid biosynthesis-associated methylase
MTKQMKADDNAQESFWKGSFGDSYTDRNQQPIAPLQALFREILRDLALDSATELGANRGLNMQALRGLYPAANLTAVEINKTACGHLRSLGGIEVVESSLLQYQPTRPSDLSFTKGVLIHIAPEDLAAAYETLLRCSSRYVLVVEYFSTQPQEVAYRGHSGRLWKRDFAGEIMDRYPVKLLRYGFVYRRDKRYVDDDTTWFLMEKE